METPWMVGCVTKLALESEGHLDIFISNGKVRVPKSGSKPHLPLDLCSEILCRLPVKSLLRFRCVSKSWRSLIDDPQFCYLHLNAFKNNSHETHLFIIQRNRFSFSLSSLIVCRQTLEKTKLVPVLAGMDTEIPEKWIVQFVVDGLVLLSKRGHETMLWNPSIRRCRRVSYIGLDSFADIGIGFDPLTKDYKYVKAFSRHCRQRVAIYSVRSNSWKTCRATGDDARWSLVSDKPLDFRGSLYTTRKEVLMSFCLSTKVFTRTNLPMYDKRQYCLDLAIVDGGSSLAVIGRPWDGLGYCMIWALETNVSTNGAVSMCWSKRYAFTMDFVELFFFPKSKGDVLFQRRYLGRYGDRRKCKLDLVSYNMETQEERILQRSSSQSTSYVTVYKESLVLLN